MRGGAITLILLLPLLTLIVERAGAQVVYGTVVDDATEAPVASAAVSLIAGSGERVTTVLTDDSGVFLLQAPTAGDYRLQAQRIGYETRLSEPLVVEAGERLQVRFLLSVQPTTLEAVTVIARRGGAVTPGQIVNAERRQRGEGVFLSRREILGLEVSEVTEAIQGVEGIRVSYRTLGRRQGSGIPIRNGGFLYTSQGWGCLMLVVNESPVPDWALAEYLLPRPDQVEAIEVYRTWREVPDQHRARAWPVGQATPCGLVAIWTSSAW